MRNVLVLFCYINSLFHFGEQFVIPALFVFFGLPRLEVSKNRLPGKLAKWLPFVYLLVVLDKNKRLSVQVFLFLLY